MLLFPKGIVINPIISLIFRIKKGCALKDFPFEFPGLTVCEYWWEVLEFGILRLVNTLCHVEPFNYLAWQLLLIVIFLQQFWLFAILSETSNLYCGKENCPSTKRKKKSLDYKCREVNTFKEEILWRLDTASCILISVLSRLPGSSPGHQANFINQQELQSHLALLIVCIHSKTMSTNFVH